MSVTLSLHGKIAIVTGVSRTKGIGAAICQALAEAGAHIFFTYWSAYDESMPWGMEQNEPELIKRKVEQLGVTCECIEIDLSREESPSQVLQAVIDTIGEPNILVNNACYSDRADYQSLTSEMLDRHYWLNVKAPVMLSVEFAKAFQKHQGGRIILLTSGQSLGPMLGEVAYATTKGAMEAFVKTFAAEVAAKGITVNAVNPGPTDTGWMDEEIKHKLIHKFPFGRIGVPYDAARLIRFLASEEAQWITGQVIHSEGGFLRI
ncbi:SDR family oxidoreductase [Thermaerobacillus caldiproteolyticus]|uniref:SDR family oxidoreductase n=1 Tax=Thermaerobacillus caldiproteolyticus TaxID=247480 RepID=UPI00188B6D19|nr:SDR family oxidoreductase [Anoxybacillus caldiproteolyticus]QPA32917.1 SDR family oxidoreductase [Anoxybacillus caldiproteolyticus]